MLTALTRVLPLLAVHVLSTVIQPVWAQPVFTRADSLRGYLSPERSGYNVHFYDLDVRVDPFDRSIRGDVEIKFRAITATKLIQVDLAENLRIARIVNEKGRKLKFSREGDAVFIHLSSRFQPGDEGSIRLQYGGQPRKARNPPWDGGFIWTEDSAGHPWIAVACQGLGASSWWPNKDHGSDEPDSMRIRVTVPPGLTNISNGRRRSVDTLEDGWTAHEWFVHNPINNYSVTLNVGVFAHYSDTYIGQDRDTLILDYFVLPENLERARAQFSQTSPMLSCFEQHFGSYPFPEDGFKVVETPYVGMEHQSAIAYGNGFTNGYLGQADSREGMWFDFILIHEAGHEWFGNSITASDIADMWIHESFTTYMEAVYVECLYGYEAAVSYAEGMRKQILLDRPVAGIYHVHQEGSRDMYPKGALMLHTLRHAVRNDTLWWNTLRELATGFRHQIVDYSDVTEFFSLRLRTDLRAFFAQYLRHVAVPELEWKWIRDAKGGRIMFRWVCDQPDFQLPVRVWSGDTSYWLQATSEWNSLTLEGSQKPQLRLDSNWLAVIRESGTR